MHENPSWDPNESVLQLSSFRGVLIFMKFVLSGREKRKGNIADIEVFYSFFTKVLLDNIMNKL